MKIFGRVYKITNLINKKSYIGKTTKTIKRRFQYHYSNAKIRNSFCMLITQDIKKYGKENFIIEEVDVAYSKKELKLLEGVYISWFNTLVPNGYNITNVVNGKNKLSKSTKEKIKITCSSPENIKIISEVGKSRRGKNLGGKSKYCGVCNYNNKYASKITFNNKTIFIGNYKLESDAAKAYDIAAIKYFGNDAILNFPDLRQDYIDGKIIVNRSTRQANSKSGIKNVFFDKSKNLWLINYYDNFLNKKRTKYFKILQEAIEFKNSLQNEVNNE